MSGFLSQSAVLVVANAISALFAVVYVSLSGRWLGPAAYGDVAAALSIAYLFSLVLGPVETAVSKLAAHCHGTGDRGGLRVLTYGSLRLVAPPLAIGLIAWLAVSPLVAHGLNLPSFGVVAAVTVYSALTLLASLPRGVQRGDHRFADYGINQVGESAVRLGVGAAALFVGWQASGALLGYAAGAGAALAIALWQLRDLRGAPSSSFDVRRIGAFSVPLTLVYVYFLSIVNVDVITAKRYLTAEHSGLYGAASSLSRLLYLVATPIYQVLFSRVAALTAQGRPTRRIAAGVFALVAAGLAASYVIPWQFGELLLRLTFGPDYVAAAPILRVLWLTTSLLSLEAVVVFALLGVDRIRAAWALLLPCGVLTALLYHRHDSAASVANATLIAAVSGAVVVAALAALARRSDSR